MPMFATDHIQSPMPVVTRVVLDAGSQASPLALFAHALHHLDGDRDAAVALVQDLLDWSGADDGDDRLDRFG